MCTSASGTYQRTITRLSGPQVYAEARSCGGTGACIFRPNTGSDRHQRSQYIDHTATHLNRGIGDLMRYAALVSTAGSTTFGPHNMLLNGAELPKTRRSDEALYALALYIQSLKPPPNP